MQLPADEMLFRVVHDGLHVMRCARDQTGCPQRFADIFLHAFFVEVFDAPVDDVPELPGKDAPVPGQQPKTLPEFVAADMVAVVEPFGDVRHLADNAVAAELPDQFVHGEVVSTDVDFSDDQHFGAVLHFSGQRYLRDGLRDLLQNRQNPRNILFGHGQHLLPDLIVNLHGCRRIGGARPEGRFYIFHVVADHGRPPGVFGEFRSEFVVGIVRFQREDDDVFQAQVAKEVFIEHEVLAGPAGTRGRRHEENVDFILAVPVGRKIFQRAAQHQVRGQAFLAGGVIARHLQRVNVRHGHGLGVDAQAADGRADELRGEPSHIG